jgi:hypothetical protein
MSNELNPEEEKNFWWKLGHIRSLYLSVTLIILFIIAMYGLPKPPPKTISPYVQKTYDIINNLQPGDIVVTECANDYAWYITHIPGALGMLRQAIDRGVRLVEYETSNEGTMIFNYVILPAITPRMEKMGYVYGRDWVRLGYIAGGDAAYATMCDNPENLGTDLYGTPIKDIPLFNDFKSGADIKLVLFTGYGLYGAIRQIVTRYGTDMVAVSHSGGLQWFYVYLQTGQLDGFIHGWEGGQEYEYLIGEPGLGTFGAMAVSMGFYLCVAGIIVANIAYLGQRFTGRSKK